MEENLIQLCAICIENPATHFTECNHKYCISCLSRIKKCAMCRNPLQRSYLCSEIKNRNRNRNRNNLSTIPSSQGPRMDETNTFALRPEDYQPSGFTDFSRINNVPIINVPNFNVYRALFGMPEISYSN